MDWRTSAVPPLLFVYLVARAFWAVLDGAAWPALDSATGQGLLKVALWAVPCVALIALIDRGGLRRAVSAVGLSRAAGSGYLFGLIATAPMALSLPFGEALRVNLDAVADSLLLGPFAEEVLFRGFLMTWLVRRAGWQPSAAIGVSALVFGLAHVPDLSVSLGRIAVFGVGGALFGWIYHRWGSLWPAIGLHACINLWWSLSIGQDAALPDARLFSSLSVAHGVSVVLAVALTLARPTGPRQR
jgi:membrane protease YdiL (CAAX protease family)